MLNNSVKHRSKMFGDQCRQWGEGGQQGQFAPGPQAPNQCWTCSRSVRQSHSSLASLKGCFAVFSSEVSLLFCSVFYAAEANYLSGYCTVCYLGPHRSHFSI